MGKETKIQFIKQPDVASKAVASIEGNHKYYKRGNTYRESKRIQKNVHASMETEAGLYFIPQAVKQTREKYTSEKQNKKMPMKTRLDEGLGISLHNQVVFDK